MENTKIINNPLLSVSSLNDQAVAFDKIQNEHYLPAFKELIKNTKTTIEEIANAKGEASFENTIEALEYSSAQLEAANLVFFNLKSAHTNDSLNELANEVAPMMSAFSNSIYLNDKLFQKVKTVYDQKDQLNLDSEQTQLLDKTYKAFVRNGALLSATDKETLKELDKELSVLSPQFGNNVLKAMNAYYLNITNEKDLSGLPESAIEAAAALANEKGQKGWTFSLQYPSYLPFVKYADNRELREKLFKAMGSLAFKDEFDNSGIVHKIVNLKTKRANLLGYETHAHFILEERMAQTPETVMEFLSSLYEPSYGAAINDVKEVQELANELGGPQEIMPWDYSYYAEKLKEKKYKFNSEELRPYFKLENVTEGAFEHARRLYGIEFKKSTDYPVYHPDVNVYEVYETGTSKYVGLFYTDFFPRESKRSGAWMTLYRNQGTVNGEVKRPHVSIVCNFTKPTADKPSLLTFDEVRTLFHEFGHALHGLLSQCKYQSVAGTNVYWDFVELPSQVMENWILEKEGLDLFAKHYKTGEAIPAEYTQKIKDSSNFQAGYASLRQLNFGYLDMAWHFKGPQTDNIEEFEKKATEKTQVLPTVDGSNKSCSFGHIFAGGYSAGYYSYKWAEVLDADAFEAFLEKGLFDSDTAQKFKSNILEKGGSEHPMELYKKFRGREPKTEALLKRSGLI